MKKFKVILIGAGLRGQEYTDVMATMPEQYDVIAVAEPENSRRDYIKEKHNIPDDMCFTDYHPLLELGKIADAALITTQDRFHIEPALKAIELGYDILLEKPMAVSAKECKLIADKAEEKGVKAVICTVLRYTPMYMTVKDIILSGRIGKIMSLNHEECVGNVHQSHSYVRGNWGNLERSSNMLLAKSCHDTDLIQWLIDKQPVKIQSFGTLSYFTEKNAPKGAPDYCIEGCPEADNCPYNAVKLYLDDKENMWFRTASTKKVEPTDEDVEKAIRETQYGKCVYKCDNDVVDHQTVNMLFEDNVTATFTMNAFNKGGRFMHIFGTKGEMHIDLSENSLIKIYDFKTKETETIDINEKEGIVNGHGGGDEGIVKAFYAYLCDEYTGTSIPGIRQACDNHLIVFAAEESRENNTVVDFKNFIKSI